MAGITGTVPPHITHFSDIGDVNVQHELMAILFTGMPLLASGSVRKLL